MAPASRRNANLVDNQNAQLSEEDKLRKEIEELEAELYAAKDQRKFIADYRKNQLTYLQRKLKGLTKQLKKDEKLLERRTKRLENFSKKAQKRSVLVVKREKAMRERTAKFEKEMKELKSIPNRKKNELLVEKERKKKLKAREDMLEVQKSLQRKQEEADGTRMPWRNCQICFEEYANEGAHIPRVLECGHTLCESCVRRLHYAHFVECPFDRKDTFVYVDGIEKLPKNCAILHM